MNALVYADIDQGPGHSLGEKIKFYEMKNEKMHGFSYDKNIANFEAFL